MVSFSYKFRFALIGAIVIPVFGRIALEGTGNELEYYRYIVPLFVGGISGCLIGLMTDKWALLNTVLKSNNDQLKLEIEERKTAEMTLKKEKNKLHDAMSRVKELTGLLPICSSCKKIRDDNGYWNQLEKYIEANSDASFSHGICPDCSEEIYGTQDWFIQMKKEKTEKRE